MSDQRRYHSSNRGAGSPESSKGSLARWLRQAAGVRLARVGSRLRGNDLHILIENRPCPDAAFILPKLAQTLACAPLEALLPPGSPQVYRVIVYARQTDEQKPAWTQAFYLNQPLNQPGLGVQPESAANAERSPSSAAMLAQPPDSSAIVPMLHLAKLGQPEAISRYLSQAFSDLGVAVKARVETVEKTDLRRLFISCESAYSPDPLLLAEPIAQRLREMELQGFRDAVVFGQVSGEARPEWLLRVDLTPTSEILQEWARWGDVQAIARLLNQVLAAQHIWVTALLKDSTVHLTCAAATPTAVPDKLTAIAAIAPALESLSPQGITGATIYGIAGEGSEFGRSNASLSPASVSQSPQWVHWINLPALSQPTLAPTTLALAQQKSLDALTFLLTRLLNPDLNWTLATGGVRVQLRQKGDLLHIMTDAPTCPNQRQVGLAVARFLRPLQIPGLSGVRIYGRRAGQKAPLWSYGEDFTVRDRLVPEVTPEFAASDAYVDDLLAPAGALVVRSDLPPDDWRFVLGHWLDQALSWVQRSLIQTQLFIPAESANLDANLDANLEPAAEALANRNRDGGASVALIWSAVGLLLVIQADWLLGLVLQPPKPKPIASALPAPVVSPLASAAPSQPMRLPQVSLRKPKSAELDGFDPSGFTQPGNQTPAQIAAEKDPATKDPATGEANQPDSAPAQKTTDSATLPASALQPKAAIANNKTSPTPTLNSRQLDEKLALYQHYLQEHGAAPDVLIVGSSRALRGVDPVALKTLLAEQGYRDVAIFNFGINGATAQVVDLVLRQMLPQDKLPRLILFADGARAFNSGRQDITYNGILASEGYKALVAENGSISETTQAANSGNTTPSLAASTQEGVAQVFASGYQMFNRELDKQLGLLSQVYGQRDRLKTLLRDQLANLLPKGSSLLALGQKLTPGELSDATSPAASALNSPPTVLTEGGDVDVNGFLPLPNRFNPVTYYQKYARVSGDYDSDYDSFNLDGQQAEAMVSMVQFVQARQIPFVFVNLPLTNDYLDPSRKRHEEAFQQHMLNLSTQLGFTYLDLSLTLADQPSYFSDPSHLNRYGAYEVSRRLAQAVMIPWQQAR